MITDERLATILKSKTAQLTEYFTTHSTIASAKLVDLEKHGIFTKSEIIAMTERCIKSATVEHLTQQVRIAHFATENSVISITLLSKDVRKSRVKLSELESLFCTLRASTHMSVRLKVLDEDECFLLINDVELLVLKKTCFGQKANDLMNQIGREYCTEVFSGRQSGPGGCVRMILTTSSLHLVPSLCIEILKTALNKSNETEIEWCVL